jgi:undecaprenyl diphosphate synthase
MSDRTQDLFEAIDRAALPAHVAVIMDGNGRWASRRGLPRVAGHRAGIRAVRDVLEGAGELGIPVLTLYAFSSENWKRPESEVRTLMELLREYLARELDAIHRNNVRFGTIGDTSVLAPEIRSELRRATVLTEGNTGVRFNVALNYSGRAELLRAVNHLIRDSRENPELAAGVDSAMLERYLYTRDLPDPDLLIRTSGELRVSNFLLWQIAYSEIWVTDTLWPDFRKRHLYEAVVSFQKRERRYGGLVPTLASR